MKKYILMLTIFTATLLSGCATKQFVPVPRHDSDQNFAIISLNRENSLLGAARVLDVYDNGKHIGEIASDGLLKWSREEGEMFIEIKQSLTVVNKILFNVKRGENYFFTVDYQTGCVKLDGNPTIIKLTSNPPGALVYVGDTIDNMELEYITPKFLPDFCKYLKPKFYKMTLNGYNDSPVIYKNNSIGTREVHFDLVPLK